MRCGLGARGIRAIQTYCGLCVQFPLTERDIRLVESFKDVDPRTLLIADAMSQDVSR